MASHRIKGRSQRGRDKGGEDEVRLVMRLRCGTMVERGYIEEGVRTRCDRKGKGKEIDMHLDVYSCNTSDVTLLACSITSIFMIFLLTHCSNACPS